MVQHFKGISEPRQEWKIRYNLPEIIVMTICAVISGCEHWEEIVDFSRVKASWFQEKLGLELKNGVASHDTFQRVFQLIRPEELEAGFLSWVRSVARITEGEIISRLLSKPKLFSFSPTKNRWCVRFCRRGKTKS